MRRYPVLDHLVTLTDDVGVIQHAIHDIPNRATGYCTDDVARALMVALAATERNQFRETAMRLAETYLSFIYDAQLSDGRFHNFMGYDRRWLDIVGTQDSFGRALWAVGFGLRYAPRDSWQRVCSLIFEGAFSVVATLEYSRARAYAVIGMAHAYEARRRDDATLEHAIRCEAEALADLYAQNASPDWQWFEPFMTYDNARLSEAVLRAGAILDEPRLIQIGLNTLHFYESVTIEERTFVPIGNQGWYPRGGVRARFGQQPLEAAAMVDAALVAADISRDSHFEGVAEIAHDWYFGRNSLGALLVTNGGCRDGIDD
ncbi:MAG: glycosyl transferase family 1, partial [Candidatus Eremiobacteraeota bacterium]|nr:glycosyl transferase family 1 [Candidatus Eremiobacteraeota bacterium]